MKTTFNYSSFTRKLIEFELNKYFINLFTRVFVLFVNVESCALQALSGHYAPPVAAPQTTLPLRAPAFANLPNDP